MFLSLFLLFTTTAAVIPPITTAKAATIAKSFKRIDFDINFPPNSPIFFSAFNVLLFGSKFWDVIFIFGTIKFFASVMKREVKSGTGTIMCNLSLFSSSYFKIAFFIFALARLRRDITVPAGQSSTSAISVIDISSK